MYYLPFFIVVLPLNDNIELKRIRAFLTMAITLKSRGYNPGPELFYDEKFLRIIEDHLVLLTTSPKATVREITPTMTSRYEHDFIGFLNFLKVPNETHPIVIRVNGMKSAEDFDQSFTNIILPASDEIEQIRQAYLASYA